MLNKKNVFNETFNRLLGLGIQNQKQLAEILGISTSSINGAKQRGVFPKKWVSILCECYEKSPNWIMGTETPPDQISGTRDKNEIIQLLKENSLLKDKVQRLEEEVSFLKTPKYSKRVNRAGRKTT